MVFILCPHTAQLSFFFAHQNAQPQQSWCKQGVTWVTSCQLCQQMWQVQSSATSVAPACAVGMLRLGSSSPRWCYGGQKVLQTARERKRGHDHSLTQRQAAAMPPSLSNKSSRLLLPLASLGAVFPQRSPALLWAHPTGPQLSETGRARETVMLWDGHRDLLLAAPQHSPTKASFGPPSLTGMLNWSPGMSAHWTLLAPEFKPGELATSQLSLAQVTTPRLLILQSTTVCIWAPAWVSVTLHHSVIFLCNGDIFGKIKTARVYSLHKRTEKVHIRIFKHELNNEQLNREIFSVTVSSKCCSFGTTWLERSNQRTLMGHILICYVAVSIK